MEPTIYFAHLKTGLVFSLGMRNQLAQQEIELINYYENFGILKLKISSDKQLERLKQLEFLESIESEDKGFGV